MRYEFLTNSQKAWQAMLQAVQSAEHSIYLEMYIFENDIKDFNFWKVLEEKAQSGVRVKVILDSFGSNNLSKKSITNLRNKGAEVFFLSYFLHRTHRKILVVDDAVAFIGGVNFHRISRPWNDLVLHVRGGRLVTALIRSFAQSYVQAGGMDSTLLKQNKKVILDKTRSWIIEHYPVKKKFILKKVYQKHLRQAKESIIFVTPYFFPERWFIGLLHQAILRGVRVKILIPRVTNHFLMDRVSRFFMQKLSLLGVEFYLLPLMNHAKVMVVDGKEGMVGSNNLDFLSFEWNSEVGVFFQDAPVVQQLLQITKDWEKDSILFDSKLYKMRWFDYILSPFIAFFTRIVLK